MSNCSQNCWISWNSAALCFKRLFHIQCRGMNVCQICAASLSHYTLCMGNLVWFQEPHMYVSHISLVGKTKRLQKRWPVTRNRRLFLCLMQQLFWMFVTLCGWHNFNIAFMYMYLCRANDFPRSRENGRNSRNLLLETENGIWIWRKKLLQFYW